MSLTAAGIYVSAALFAYFTGYLLLFQTVYTFGARYTVAIEFAAYRAARRIHKIEQKIYQYAHASSSSVSIDLSAVYLIVFFSFAAMDASTSRLPTTTSSRLALVTAV